MQDNSEEKKSVDEDGYNYPKKANIPIKFSDNVDKKDEDELDSENEIAVPDNQKNNTKTFSG